MSIGDDVRKSLEDVETMMALLQAEQQVAIKYQKGVLTRAQMALDVANKQISVFQKKFTKFEDGEINMGVDEFLEIQDAYENLILDRKKLQTAIEVAEETIAEAELGMTSPTTRYTGKSLGAIVDE